MVCNEYSCYSLAFQQLKKKKLNFLPCSALCSHMWSSCRVDTYAVARPAAMPCCPALCAVLLYLSVSAFTMAEADERPPSLSMVKIIPHMSYWSFLPLAAWNRSLWTFKHFITPPLLLQIANQRGTYTARHLSICSS